jgi:three-Cys-motif partner protein
VYIDGFSGPGRYTGGEPGSPLVALDVAINHRQTLDGEIAFWFMDERQDRIDHLAKNLPSGQYPNTSGSPSSAIASRRISNRLWTTSTTAASK